jgi:hypothetical protein
MGAPWRLAFGVSGSIDRFGFGWRASFAVPGTGTAGQIHYTVARAFITLAQSMGALPRFLVAAPVVIVFAATAVYVSRRDVGTWLLVASIGCVAFGYLVWWGTANAVHFGIHVTLGPFYHYAVIGPLVILAAQGLLRLRARSVVTVIVVLAAVAWVLPASVLAFRNARNAGRVRANEVALVRPPGRSLVLEAPLFPHDPYVRVANDAALGGRALVAVDIPGRELEVIRRFPDRVAYVVETYRRRGDLFGPQVQRRVRTTVTSGRALDVAMRATVPDGKTGRAYLRVDDQTRYAGPGRDKIASTFRLTPDMLPRDGRVATVAAGVRFGADWYECRFEAALTSDRRVEGLSPCATYAHYTFPNGATAESREDLSDVMQVDLRSP